MNRVNGRAAQRGRRLKSADTCIKTECQLNSFNDIISLEGHTANDMLGAEASNYIFDAH
jgi:hypothetical protein